MLVFGILFSKLFKCKSHTLEGADICHVGRETFNNIFDELVFDVIATIENEVTKDAADWIKTMIDYTVPGGKQNRGLSVLNAYHHLVGHSLNELEIKQSSVLGWCIEWLQAFFLVADDIMDNSLTRRGQPCWYRKENVGHIAINDSFILESCIYVLLKKYLRGHPSYMNLVELFHEISLQTEVGQALDLLSSPNNKELNYEVFTLKRYQAIVKYKTAFYSFYLPIASAMFLHGVDAPEVHQEAKAILLEMGEYYQIQDDFLDCFGDPLEIGKIGTDIEEGKCSWLAVKAMHLMNHSQKETFKANFAIDREKNVQIIKEIYRELNIEAVFRDYENSSYRKISKMIDINRTALPKQVFLDFLDKIYKRKK